MYLAILHGFQGLNLGRWSGLFHNCFYRLSHLGSPIMTLKSELLPTFIILTLQERYIAEHGGTRLKPNTQKAGRSL